MNKETVDLKAREDSTMALTLIRQHMKNCDRKSTWNLIVCVAILGGVGTILAQVIVL